MPKHTFLFAAILVAFFSQNSFAITLNSAQTDFTTSADITTSASGIISSLNGSSGNLNKITNLHTITTGNSGATSSAYGIRVSGVFNQVLNDVSGIIQTTGSSGRGISISDFSSATNAGNISTLGTSSYGIYAGGDNNLINNFGQIQTVQSYGIYLDGNFNLATNSGNITTTGGTSAYGIYISAGSDLAATPSNFTQVENSGNINSFDHGIYNRDNFSVVTNSGIINPLNNTDVNGINNEGDEAVINNSGTIFANRYAIYNNGEDAIINNSGTLNGGVRLGNSSLNILGGTISGVIDGSNVGRVNIGSDLVNVDYVQENNFENLSTLTIKQNSNFSANGLIEAQTIFIENNANLNLSNGFSSTATIRAVNNNEGNLNLNNITFNGKVGISGNALENFYIAPDAVFTSTDDIYSANVFLAGILNLPANNNSQISGNLNVGANSFLNIGAQNHTILGDFSLQKNATLSAVLNNNSLGNLTISGTANVESDAKLSLNFSGNNYIADKTRFTILSANLPSNISEISAQNISINNSNSNIFGLLRFTSLTENNALYLQANRLEAEEISDNSNIQNIYSTLNKIGNSSYGNLRQFQTYIDSANLSTNQLNLTLNQIAFWPTKANLIISNNIVNNIIKIDEKRLLKKQFDASISDGFWMEAFGNNLKQQKTGDDEEFSANSIGLVIGFDREFDEDLMAGFSLAYARSFVKLSDNSKTNFISTYQTSFFAKKQFEPFFIDFITSIALHQFLQNKNITALNLQNNAKYNGQTYNAKIKFGAVAKLSQKLKLIPQWSLNFSHHQIDSYKENGADSLNLKVSQVTANFLEARFGSDLAYITKIDEFVEFDQFAFLLKTSIGYNLINDKPKTQIEFMGNGAGFENQISQIDPASIRLGFGIDATHIDDVNFSFEYFLEKRRSLDSHFAGLKIRQAF